jgi:hypothetical protein
MEGEKSKDRGGLDWLLIPNVTSTAATKGNYWRTRMATKLGGAGPEEKSLKEHKRKRAKWFLIILSCPPTTHIAILIQVQQNEKWPMAQLLQPCSPYLTCRPIKLVQPITLHSGLRTQS